MSLHFPDGPVIQSTAHLKTTHFHVLLSAMALSGSSIPASLILMLSVSLLISEDALKLIFRMRCDLLLFCVSGLVQLVSLILFFFLFMRLLRLFSCAYNWYVLASLWKPSFVRAFHCDFPSLGTSWIKMSPLLLTGSPFLLFSFCVISHHYGS